MAKKKWIQEAKISKWALHKQLWIPEDKKIPKSLIEKLANADIWDTVEWHKVTALLKRRAVLARTLRSI